MLRRPSFATGFVSGYLLIYLVLLLQNNQTLHQVACIQLLLSPLLLIWLAYTVIRYGRFTGRELKGGEEFGYEDRDKDDLGVI